MSAFNSVWQNSHASLRYRLGCEKEKALCCLRTEGAVGVEGGGGQWVLHSPPMTSNLPSSEQTGAHWVLKTLQRLCRERRRSRNFMHILTSVCLCFGLFCCASHWVTLILKKFACCQVPCLLIFISSTNWASYHNILVTQKHQQPVDLQWTGLCWNHTFLHVVAVWSGVCLEGDEAGGLTKPSVHPWKRGGGLLVCSLLGLRGSKTHSGKSQFSAFGQTFCRIVKRHQKQSSLIVYQRMHTSLWFCFNDDVFVIIILLHIWTDDLKLFNIREPL